MDNQVAVVTGASRGIGKGIARVLAESGARVMVTALTDKYLAPLTEEMESAGYPIENIAADATNTEDWQRTLDFALDRWGHIDVLINNLGDAIRKPLVPLPGAEDSGPISDEEWRFVVDINLTQAFMGCRTVGPYFIERRRGKVINVSGFAALASNQASVNVPLPVLAMIPVTASLASPVNDRAAPSNVIRSEMAPTGGRSATVNGTCTLDPGAAVTCPSVNVPDCANTG